MSHYYTTDDTPHEYGETTFDFNDYTYRFKTDRGVFSKNNVDYGSALLIKTVVDTYQGDGSFIDMGTGYGPIGIVIGRELGMHPIMVEVNKDAADLADENAKRAGISVNVMSRHDFDESNIDTSLYVTNPPFRAGKDVVLEILRDAYERLTLDGAIYMVVQKKQGMASYKKYLQSTFGNVQIVVKDKGYYILKSIK